MISYRPLNPDDHAVICTHRNLMFTEMGKDPVELAQAMDLYAAWLTPRLADGSYFGFLVEDGKEVIAGVGLRILDFAPGPNHPSADQRGYVLDVYVQPQYRGQGIANQLMQHAEDELRGRGVTYATLHASDAGRPVYEKRGWNAAPEMGKKL
jgi:ribosomal protein S18 acetylase RimI-like enzyme